MKRRLARMLLFTVTAAGAGFTIPAGAAARAGGYYVTFVARQCPSYSDIYAHGARGDSDESLEPLGSDTDLQKTCRPLPGWPFTLGAGRARLAATGAWGSLARVANPYRAPILTTASGAVTVKLTAAQISQAQRTSGLWVQGGTPTRPVTSAYGFGTLRCAHGLTAGENAARLFFPATINHVRCYAYYVTPSPRAGTIVIHERLEGGQAGAQPAMPFTGDLTYNRDGFTLKNGQSVTFHRAGGGEWTVTQPAVPNYRLQSISCTSSTGGSTALTRGRTVTVALAPDDTVNCTFVSEWVTPLGSLTIVEITEGGVGSFTYIVEPHDDPTLVTARTRQPGVPVDAHPEGNLALLAAEVYSVQELREPRAPGRWPLVGAECDGRALKLDVYDLRLVNGRNTVCTFTNRLIPSGSIRLSSVTEGGTGTAAFMIQSLGATARQFLQSDTTRHAGVAAVATPNAPADTTAHVDRGRYLITEQPPLGVHRATAWSLTAVSCNGARVPMHRGSIVVALTRRTPHLACRFTDRLGKRGG